MKYSIFILFIILSFTACKKKELPVPVSNSPIFKFIGSIGNDSINYQAGVNRMYMYTGFYKDSQSLLTIRSYFAKDDCTNCEPYLSFEVKDFDISQTNGLAGTLADLLKGGGTFNSYSLDSVLTTTNVEQFLFIPTENNFGATYEWSFGDGATSSLKSPTYVFPTGGMKDVQLVVKIAGALNDTLINTINTDSFSSCRSQFLLTKDTLQTAINVSASPIGFNYAWDFGDSTTGNGMNTNHSYSSGGKYIVTLNASQPSCSSIYRQKVDFSLFNTPSANFIYQTSASTISALTPRLNKSAFIITWIKNGVVYKSFKNVKGINQSGNPVFTFLGVMPYQNNEKGEKTVMITGTVDTYLYNQANWQDSIKIKSNNIVLAGSYPE